MLLNDHAPVLAAGDALTTELPDCLQFGEVSFSCPARLPFHLHTLASATSL
jgi:hypothetical protein